MTVHWAGTGLSAVPGLRRLLERGHDVTVWNRSAERARVAVGDLTDRIQTWDAGRLAGLLQPGDVVVSMLPADMHPPIAQTCLERGAHFVSSSYVSPQMAALDEPARAQGLCLVNEIGLDPGIDHLMAHALVEDYRGVAQAGDELSFLSYCGGVPRHPNAFRYKFSWSPLGVLRALRSPSRSIRHWSELRVQRPWDAITTYAAPLPVPESFEVYPNRDSIPFMAQYHFDPSWRVRNFVRGTLRLNGWAEAWAPVFAEIETLSGPEGEARLKAMAEEFWERNAYGPDEPDRVVLCVDLKVEQQGQVRWHKSFVMDAWGDQRGTAMSRLVSVPVSLAVEAVLDRRIAAGVSAATSDPALVADWLAETERLAQVLIRTDHLKMRR